ncbi:polysaccharide biosynthesis C-terminal domain-containing protein [Alkalihalobacillus clausii]|nr:polysaccharide biosynthesis C-terminal domain-containing protein [Shouchella clausii]
MIPSLGVLGAAISTAATMIFWNLVLYLLVRKKVGINTFSVKRIFY